MAHVEKPETDTSLNRAATRKKRFAWMSKPIVETGSGTLHNYDLKERAAKWDDDQIFKRVGIRSRPIVEEGEDVVSLATIAARQAVKASGLALEDFQSVICSSCTAKRSTPSIASDVLKNLVVERGGEVSKNAVLPPAFDINAACSGFLYGLQLAFDQLAQDAGPVLLLTSEVISPLINLDDPNTAYVFGDAATATIIYADNPPDLRGERLAYSRPILASAPDFEAALRSEEHTVEDGFLRMNGMDVARIAKKQMSNLSLAACQAGNCETGDLQWVIAHQANQRILDGVAWGLDIPKEQLITTLESTGNTSSSSVPICLSRNWDKVHGTESPSLLTAFGAGYTVASAIAFPNENFEREDN